MISYPVKQAINLNIDGQTRTPGVHLSGIIRVMRERSGMNPAPRHSKTEHLGETPEENAQVNELYSLYETTQPEDVGTSGPLMRAIIGLTWEEWINRQIPGLIYHPGEFMLDGVIMTPDGVQITESGDYVLHEFKATFKSSKTPVTAKADWMWQCASYLKAMSAKYGEPCLKAVIHPLHIRGDYRGIDPLYLPQVVEFEQEEVDLVWQEVLRYKPEAREE